MRQCVLDSSMFGGIETQVQTLAVYLAQQGYEVEVLFIKSFQGNPLYQALSDNNIKFCFAGSVKGY